MKKTSQDKRACQFNIAPIYFNRATECAKICDIIPMYNRAKIQTEAELENCCTERSKLWFFPLFRPECVTNELLLVTGNTFMVSFVLFPFFAVRGFEKILRNSQNVHANFSRYTRSTNQPLRDQSSSSFVNRLTPCVPASSVWSAVRPEQLIYRCLWSTSYGLQEKPDVLALSVVK